MVFSDANIRRADGTEWTVSAALEALKTAIWQRRPILGEIMKTHGEQNLFNYAKDFLDVNQSPILDARKGELISVTHELVAERLGSDVADSVARQLAKRALVSTTDHHGPIQHPFFLNANIISALPYKAANDETLESLIVFSFASVSMNNASTYARGLMFHGGMNGTSNLIKLPIYPDKLKMSIVYSTRAFDKEDLARAHADLDRKVTAKQVLPERAQKVHAILDSLEDPSILNADDANQQFTKMNYKLWPTYFKGREKMPNLIYVDIESLVRRLLLRSHLKNSSTLIHRVLFDASVRALAIKHFNGLPGAFSLEKEWGSVLFWGIDPHGHRVRLVLNGEKLESRDSSISIDLTPNSIADALRARTIYPSMMLCYLMISLYYGMKCLGGFCQVHDLTMIKRAWRTLLREIGQETEADALDRVQTKELGGDGLVLSYTKAREGGLIPATGIDMAIETELDTSYEQFSSLSKAVTLAEMMQPMLPEMYSVLYTAEERDAILACLLPEQISNATGLQKKLTEILTSSLAHAA